MPLLQELERDAKGGSLSDHRYCGTEIMSQDLARLFQRQMQFR